MIITCEKCQTRFHLDDRIVGQQKKPVLRVRCSRCRHVFAHRLVELEPVHAVADPAHPVVSQHQIVAVCNQKGGVAKTSTCLNLGMSLALLGKKVLLVDFDVQSNLSISLGFREQASMYEVIHGGADAVKGVIRKTRFENLWLIPGNSRMALLTQQFLKSANYQNLLSDRLDVVRDRFDVILIDTPPSVEFFTLNAIMAANLVIIPTQCEYFSFQGVEQVRRIIGVINRNGSRRIDYRVLMTMYDDSRLTSRVLSAKFRSRYGDKAFQTVVDFDENVTASQIVRKPVIYHDRHAPSARQYLALAKEFLSR